MSEIATKFKLPKNQIDITVEVQPCNKTPLKAHLIMIKRTNMHEMKNKKQPIEKSMTRGIPEKDNNPLNAKLAFFLNV